ncbi:2073_t:CDS:2 [Dentiscutata erythropus]|uniref:2073_t:CDS:1 n=1 Tax=Dentiscutata erythropus TaxID=1348616 RepID=A0A9N9NIZ7_9GLOM|nr:2073_t:CDS:2 [Dentiscutata erythropus]
MSSKKLSSPPRNRRNVTKACDSCKRKKIRCLPIIPTDQYARCDECTKRSCECTYHMQARKRGPKSDSPSKHIDMRIINHSNYEKSTMPNTNSVNKLYDAEQFLGLSLEEMSYLSKIYNKQELPSILSILNSANSQPCPYQNIAGHYCHEGCILIFRSFFRPNIYRLRIRQNPSMNLVTATIYNLHIRAFKEL